LSLLAGPERIESGWWDEGEASGEGITGDQRRDYFVARNPQGEWLWVFRDEAGWFLHGGFA
jgi:protein ImuB